MNFDVATLYLYLIAFGAPLHYISELLNKLMNTWIKVMKKVPYNFMILLVQHNNLLWLHMHGKLYNNYRII